MSVCCNGFVKSVQSSILIVSCRYLHVRFDRFRTPGPMVHVEDFIDSVRSSSALAKAIGVFSIFVNPCRESCVVGG